ncbi:MAG: CHAT domain-containing protein [Pyrinomonadaceae bacterium]
MFQKNTFFSSLNFLIGKSLYPLLLLFCLTAQSVHSQTPGARVLEPGNPVRSQFSGGEKQEYQIKLTKGQYALISVSAGEAELKIDVLSPGGEPVSEIGSSQRKGQTRTIEIIAETPGDHILKIGAPLKSDETKSYEIKLEEIRPATETDFDSVKISKMSLEVQSARRAQKFDEAIAKAEKALALIARVRGPENAENSESAFIYNELGLIFDEKGELEKAEEYYQKTLPIYRQNFGPEDNYVATIEHNLGDLYRRNGRYEKAEEFFQSALKIFSGNLGADSDQVASVANSLAFLYFEKGEYTKAEQTHLKALAIREKLLGEDAPAVAYSVNNLALVYHVKGDFPKAQSFLQRALSIFEKHLPKDHPNIAILVTNLAAISSERGDYKKGEELFRRALAMNEKIYGKDHFRVASTLNGLGILYDRTGDFKKAEGTFQRALEIREKVFGAEHRLVAISLNSLASVYRNLDEPAKAEPLYLRALAIQEKALGRNHQRVAVTLTNLGALYLQNEDYAKAEPLLQRALVIFEQTSGKDHPLTAMPVKNLALLSAGKNDLAKALELEKRFLTIRERNLELNLAIGSERQKLAYLKSLFDDMFSAISMNTRLLPESAEAREMALKLILLLKGRSLDSMAENLSALRRSSSAEDRDLIDQLSDVKTGLANLTLKGRDNAEPEKYQQQLKVLNERRENLENELSRKSSEYSLQRETVTPEKISRLIPSDGALIEFIVYDPESFEIRRAGKSPDRLRYIAYILRPNGEIRWREIGDAESIDKAIIAYRQALNDPKRKDVKTLGRSLDEKVFKPVRDLLGDSTRLLISPDGLLNLIPFEALVSEKERFLVEDYSFNYLSSGRDLLRMQVGRKSRTKPVLVANPSFGDPVSTAGTNPISTARRSITATRDLSDTYFSSLEGTKQEADSIKKLFPEAVFLSGEKATETALKQVASPSILHIATHGFFLEDLKDEGTNPLLRSGLALTGANRGKSGEDDGILTALEASGLDLWGTKLVVLSACDTGLGEVRNGEGVYGLRRSFVLAGTESLVMSLWAVSDYVTRELMTEYYKNLKAGMGRNEALRKVQLGMLKKKNRQHPFYWAGFIQSGEWANLDGKR